VELEEAPRVGEDVGELLNRALGVFLLQGPRGALFLMSEVPLYLEEAPRVGEDVGFVRLEPRGPNLFSGWGGLGFGV
jgi:hypothetical protein